VIQCIACGTAPYPSVEFRHRIVQPSWPNISRGRRNRIDLRQSAVDTL